MNDHRKIDLNKKKIMKLLLAVFSEHQEEDKLPNPNTSTLLLR